MSIEVRLSRRSRSDYEMDREGYAMLSRWLTFFTFALPVMGRGAYLAWFYGVTNQSGVTLAVVWVSMIFTVACCIVGAVVVVFVVHSTWYTILKHFWAWWGRVEKWYGKVRNG
jgi:hypothetical protein